MADDKLHEKIDLPAEVIESQNQVKNLIFLQLESFSNEFVQDELICPNLNNYSKLYEYVAPINSEPYTTWSTSATIALQIGIPQIIPETSWNTRGRAKIEYFKDIKGIPEILRSFGYKTLFATRGNAQIMGFNVWIKFRNYTQIYKARSDFKLFDYLTRYINELDREVRYSNFTDHYFLFIKNEETHSDYKKPKWCKRNFPKFEEKHKCFHCIDSLVGKFVRKFLEKKMYEHTLLAVFSDHVPFARQMFSIEPKELFFLFPGMKKVDKKFKVTDDVTFYDFGPTIMDLIGIKKYSPEFPFGRKIYNNNNNDATRNEFAKHHKPDNNDLSIIYKFLHFERGKNIVSHYNLSQQFRCYVNSSQSFYYSNVPCSITKVF